MLSRGRSAEEEGALGDGDGDGESSATDVKAAGSSAVDPEWKGGSFGAGAVRASSSEWRRMSDSLATLPRRRRNGMAIVRHGRSNPSGWDAEAVGRPTSLVVRSARSADSGIRGTGGAGSQSDAARKKPRVLLVQTNELTPYGNVGPVWLQARCRAGESVLSSWDFELQSDSHFGGCNKG